MNYKYEHIGYYEEFYINGKFIGTIPVQRPDDRKIGYDGKQTMVVNETIICDNKKKIKKGTQVYSMVFPLCKIVKL